MEEPFIYETEIFHVIGLLEELESLGGKTDMNTLTTRTNMEYGELQKVLRVAEKLGVIYTPGSDVELTDLGKKIAVSNTPARKEIFKNILMNVDMFKNLITFIENRPSKSISIDELENFVKMFIVGEDSQNIIKGILNYTTFASMLKYNRKSNTISLVKAKK